MLRPAILWDVDGTLVDSEPLHEAALVQALQDLNIAPPEDFHQYIVGRDAREVHAWCQEHLGLELDLKSWLQRKYRTYLAAAADLRPRDGAVDMFRRLQADGHPQAIVSNSDRMVVAANLDAVGLSAPGLITVSRNDVRDGKPGPEPYLRAAWLLRVEPERCLVVEDSLTGTQAERRRSRRSDDLRRRPPVGSRDGELLGEVVAVQQLRERRRLIGRRLEPQLVRRAAAAGRARRDELALAGQEGRRRGVPGRETGDVLGAQTLDEVDGIGTMDTQHRASGR